MLPAHAVLLAYVTKMVHFASDELESLKGYLLGAPREEGPKTTCVLEIWAFSHPKVEV